ncbi:MAG: hypothetical protein IPG79_17170 [Saprospiraceae bacterium]|nr:hypothetical protein [Saprospiraceae bacterium]
MLYISTESRTCFDACIPDNAKGTCWLNEIMLNRLSLGSFGKSFAAFGYK